MIVPLVAALILAAPQQGQLVVRATELERGRLADEFDLRWQLPERPPRDAGLLPALEALASETFEITVDGDTLRTFGDLVLASESAGPGARAAWLARVEAASPRSLRGHREALRQLLLDDELRSARWNAEKDGERDGFLIGRPWELSGASPAPWDGLEVRPVIEQGATFVRSDLDTFKAVENDFRLYLGHRDARYDWIYPEPGRYFRGADGEGRPFDTSLIVFRCDLPFPFSHYDCRLHVLNRLDAAGRLRTDIYSTSRDFHFMAGLDVFLPVRDGDGAPVGFLLVRDFGFDLAGVPDKAKHRLTALRRTIGNLKLESERRTSRAGELGAIEGELSEFVMYGVRR